MMVWTGLLLGLLILQAIRLLSPPPVAPPQPTLAPPPVEAPDPYAEARRSRTILEAQEGQLGNRGEAGSGPVARLSGPVRVIDGDTFDYGGTRIRIADIDTPEVNGRCPHETQLAARATSRLRTLLAAGPFELHLLGSGRDEDRYGRKLRIVTRNGQSMGDQLVAEGLARTWLDARSFSP